ncbi:Flp pilus assembly complex ATPase component TadA [Candidatus Dojkabacteria bacterium]|nr:Flp pilus assembly complex ATPase component TadA [Candidatus Dojkabacteria bacterium]
MSTKVLEILQNKGILSQDQTNEVKVQVTKTNKSQEQVLIELGYVSEDQLAKAKSEEFNIPFVDLSTVTIPQKLTTLINQDLLLTHKAVPFSETETEIHIAMSDPFDVPAIQAIQRDIKSNQKLKVFIASNTQILQTLDKKFGQGGISSEVNLALEDVEEPVTEIDDVVEDITAAESSLINAPVARIVNSILQYGAKVKASDIHIEPMEKDIRIRYRVNGIMAEKLRLPRSVHSAIVARIKIMTKTMKIDEKRIPQDGRIPIRVGGMNIDLRISSLPTVFGEKIVMRLLDRSSGIAPLESTGMRGSAYKAYVDSVKNTSGIVLISGPTGSGKSRTLAGTIDKINKIDVNVITLEDPVEIRIPGVNQVQVNPDVGLTFASGLRSILRQDPDIIMVGEIRDGETARLAVQAALTGHLVLSTIHTNSAAAAIPRLIDMGLETYLLSAVLQCVIAQRLVRKVCKHCVEPYLVSQPEIDDINKVLGNIQNFNVIDYLKAKCKQDPTQSMTGVKVECPVDRGNGHYDIYLYKGKGCDECGYTGYSGRIGIFEVISITDRISRMIMENKSSADINLQAIKDGMVTIMQDGYLKALEGITTIEEVLRVSKD